MKRALMITYFFPPDAGSGVQRSLYFAKYLSEFGYQPLVVHGTQRPRGGPLDYGLLDELGPEVRRFEYRGVEVAMVTAPVWKRLARMGRIGEGLAWRIGTMTDRLDQRMSPDALAMWARRLVGPVTKLARRMKADVIYSTSDPFSNHYLAWRVKRETGLPWVADFRDLWTQDWAYDPHPELRARQDRWLERKFLAEADAVLNVTEEYDRTMQGRAPPEDRGRFHVLRNGVDLARFDSAPHPRNDRFTLAYTGVLYRAQWSEALLAALKRLIAAVPDPHTVRWEVAGRMDDWMLAAAAAALGENFKYHGYLVREDARAMMIGSDALLLMGVRGPKATGNVPGKLYEYLGSGRPIVCLTPTRGETAELVERHRAGIVAGIDAEDEIFAALRTMYDAWATGRPMSGAPRDEVRAYDRRELTGRLAEIFDSIQGNRG